MPMLKLEMFSTQKSAMTLLFIGFDFLRFTRQIWVVCEASSFIWSLTGMGEGKSGSHDQDGRHTYI